MLLVISVNNTPLTSIGALNECALSTELTRICNEAKSFTVVRDGKELVIAKDAEVVSK